VTAAPAKGRRGRRRTAAKARPTCRHEWQGPPQHPAIAPLAPGLAAAAGQSALPAGGLAALDAALAPQSLRIDRILACRAAACCIAGQPTALGESAAGRIRQGGAVALGGALIFEVWRNAVGRYRLIIRFRSQTLDEMRSLSPLTVRTVQTLESPWCGGEAGCDATGFDHALSTVSRAP